MRGNVWQGTEFSGSMTGNWNWELIFLYMAVGVWRYLWLLHLIFHFSLYIGCCRWEPLIFCFICCQQTEKLDCHLGSSRFESAVLLFILTLMFLCFFLSPLSIMPGSYLKTGCGHFINYHIHSKWWYQLSIWFCMSVNGLFCSRCGWESVECSRHGTWFIGTGKSQHKWCQ